MSQQSSSSDDQSSISDLPFEKGANVVPGAILKDAELVTKGGHVVTKDGVLITAVEDDSDDYVNPFADPELKAYYVDLYDKSQYECRHVFDAELTWTPQEEKKLVRKLDWHVCLWACVMFFSLQVDRGNNQQAVSGTLLQDLKMNTNDFNRGESIFLVSFLLAELPSQLVSKKIGPDRWIPLQICLWSIVAASQAAMKSKGAYFACRVLLGVLEGGFIPDLVLWLSYFYTSRELPTRLSFFWTALSVTSIISAFLAFGIFHMDGHLGIAGWRWLFLIEGIITFSVGAASFFLMPASAVQTKTWFRPKGWFSDREVAIVVNRVLRDDPSKGDMHNRQAITPKRLWLALQDYDLWPIYALGLICFIPQSPPATYLTQTLRKLGFSTLKTNLLTIPSSFLHICTLLGITWVSEKLNQRALVAVFQSIWTLPCLIAMISWSAFFVEQWKTYALLVVLLSYPYCHAINVGWASKNSNNVGSRSISTALYNMCVQLGGVISANIYRNDDKPLYHRGNRVLIGINVLSIALFLFAKVYYVLKNRSREKRWQALTPEERIDYTRNTTDQGSRRLDFRFAH